MNTQIKPKSDTTSLPLGSIQLIIILIVFSLICKFSYPLFHELTFIFSAAVGGTIFAIAWGSRRFLDSHYLLYIGVGLLSASILSTLHALTYNDLETVPSSNSNISLELWLAAKLITSSTFVLAYFFIQKKTNHNGLFLTYLIATFVTIIAIVDSSIPTHGLLSKINIINNAIPLIDIVALVLFFISGLLLYRKRENFDASVYKFLITAVILLAISETQISGYTTSYDTFSFISHLLKITAYYLLYLGVIETSLFKPYRVIFKNLKDHETYLTESEERYRLLIENSVLAIVLQSKNKITFANKAALKMFEASQEELINKSILDFASDNHKSVLKKQLETLETNGRQSSIIESRIYSLNGTQIDAEITSNPITIKGEPAILTVLADITKRKHLERQTKIYTEKMEEYAADMRKFMLAVENASESMYITDKNFEIVYANRETEKTTGYEKSNHCDIFAAKLQGNKSSHEELLSQHRNGNEYVAQLEISPVIDRDQNISFYVFIERDISRLKEIDQAKNEFVSLASHQLRTPLSSITLTSELFLKGVYGELTEKQISSMKEIYNSCAKMKDLISDLLNISRIELGTFNIKTEQVILEDLFVSTLNDHRLALKQKDIQLETEFETIATQQPIDTNIFEIVFDNLMTNAIRYTPNGGNIKVGYNKNGMELIFWVKDNGHGIPANQQSRIFDKLFRANNAQAISADGSGLGLYMAKSVLKKIGGSIWVESIENQGSTFFVRIPLYGNTAQYKNATS
jgi:PAS domain S-box-containing protein